MCTVAKVGTESHTRTSSVREASGNAPKFARICVPNRAQFCRHRVVCYKVEIFRFLYILIKVCIFLILTLLLDIAYSFPLLKY